MVPIRGHGSINCLVYVSRVGLNEFRRIIRCVVAEGDGIDKLMDSGAQ
jgi:hypothetical protein